MPAVTRVLAIRHGETAWNVDARIQGQLDIPLNELGLWQAAQVASALAGETVDAIYTSDLQRAFQTAQPIAQMLGLPLGLEPGLRERGFGAFEGLLYPEIEARWPEGARRWSKREPGYAPEGGGESLIDFSARVLQTAARLAAAHVGQSIVLVAHGGVMDCLYRAATRVDLQQPRSWKLVNAALNRLLYTPDGFTLVGWNDVGHLEEETRDEPSDGATGPNPMSSTSA
jgi:2,3-bisphosphoglycerate-dependent phosphoglycerate mutase